MELFERSFEHKQELFDAAINEFIKKGYGKASLSHILKSAGMSKGAFYYHFSNKEDLYFGLIEVLINKKKAFLSENMRLGSAEQDIFAFLEYQLSLSIEFAALYPEIGRFSESFIKEKGNEIYHKALQKYNFMGNDKIEALIDSSFKRHELRDDLPRAFIGNMIGYLFTHAVEITDICKTDDYQENINYLIEFIKTGFARKEQSE